MSQRPLYEIWEDPENSVWPEYKWRAQMVGYAPYFRTREDAEKYVAGVQEYRRRFGQSNRDV